MIAPVIYIRVVRKMPEALFRMSAMLRNAVVCDPPPSSLKTDAKARAQAYLSAAQDAVCYMLAQALHLSQLSHPYVR